MKKNEILKILRIFCVNENKGITSTQNFLYNILFETEIENKDCIYVTFRSIENDQLILKLDNDEDLNCYMEWDDTKYRLYIYILEIETIYCVISLMNCTCCLI